MFRKAFTLYADQIAMPDTIRKPFCAELKRWDHSPRDAAKVAEKYLSTFDFTWPDGLVFLREYQGRRGTFKQLAALFAGCVYSKHRFFDQFEMAKRTSRAFPNLILSRGPVMQSCPIHGDKEGIILPVYDNYWQEYPLRESVFCRCRVRQTK